MFQAADDGFIVSQIEKLAELPTFPPFSHAFYRLIAQYVAKCDESADRLRGLFARFLSGELAYHQGMEDMVRRDQVSVGDLQSLSDKHRIHLRALLEAAHQPTEEPKQELVRHLILAETHYHLRETDRVVAHLEWAVAAGAEHPLVFFALGYNRFALALETFVRPGDNPDEWQIIDFARFQDACLQVVSAFENALGGDAGDKGVYGWIVRVLRTAGFPEAAEEAMQQAGELADEFESDEEETADEVWELEGEELHAEEGLPPISREEIEAAGESLKRSFSVDELMRQRPDTSE